MNRNRALFQNKNFLYFFFAALLGVMGEGIYGLTAIVKVLEETNSIVAIGNLLVLTLLPSVILAPFIGVWIDRLDKRKLAFACNLLRFLAIVIIPLSSYLGLFHVSIFFVSILLSYMIWFVLEPVKESLLKEILSPEEYKQGISLVQGAWQLGLLSSAIIAGFLMDRLGINTAILSASVVYVAAGLLFILITKKGSPSAEDGESNATLSQYKQDLKNGWSYIRGNKIVLYFALSTSMVLPFFYAINTLIAPFNYQVLMGDGISLGIIDSGAGIGSLLSALVCSLWIKSHHQMPAILVSIFLTALFTFLFSITTSIPVAFVMYIGIGMCIGIVRVLTRFVIFEHVEERYMGRVMTFISFVSLLLSIMMSLFISFMAEKSLMIGYFLISMFILLPIVLSAKGAKEMTWRTSVKREQVG